MGLPRRGGPAGRCHSWLTLSKENKSLRKLIPIYFPAHSVVSSSSLSGSPVNENSQDLQHSLTTYSNKPTPLREINSPVFSSKANSESGSDCAKRHPVLWNIDEDATNKLHDLLDPTLIHKSLNLSPIHWKCVPQIHGLEGKHCAAVCGVIVRRRKKPKGSLPVSEKCVITVSPVTLSESVEQPPVKDESKLPFNKFRHKTAVCHFCHCTLGHNRKPTHGACLSCCEMLRSFTRDAAKRENLVCLRDIPCSLQWPVYWTPTEAIFSESFEERVLQEHGPISEDWCTSCKVAHCLKLGCKLEKFCGRRSIHYATLKSFNLQTLNDPDFRHRSRERRAQEYLELITNDVITQFGVKSPDPANEIVVSKKTDDLYDVMLDNLWVRPIRLLSRSQLNNLGESKKNHSSRRLSHVSVDRVDPVGLLVDAAVDCQLCVHAYCDGRSDSVSITDKQLAFKLFQSTRYVITIGPLEFKKRCRLSVHSSNLLPGSQSSDPFETSSEQASVVVCGLCLLHIRSSAHQFLSNDLQHIDCLSKVLREPRLVCDNVVSGQPTEPDTERRSCIERSASSLCSGCHVSRCLGFIYTRLYPVLQKKFLSDDRFSDTKSVMNKRVILPVGGPLIPPHVHGCDRNTMKLSAMQVLPKHCAPDPDHNPLDALQCICCHKICDFLSHYRRNNSRPNRCICSGCLWTFKLGITSATYDVSVRRMENQLSSAAVATDTAVPLLSRASRRTLLNTARLACILSAPCTTTCTVAKPGKDRSCLPLWATCPACTARRCYRLAISDFPLRYPKWFRRRIRLTESCKSLEDLDPRLLWPNLAGSQSLCPDKDDKFLHRLSLVDTEFTASMIERWLMPPEPRGTVTHDEVNLLPDGSSDSSTPTSDDLFEHDMLDEASSCSTNPSSLILSKHSSEYGNEGWWDRVNDLSEFPEQAETDADCIGSDTEPETDAIAAEELTVAFTESKHNNESSTELDLPATDSAMIKFGESAGIESSEVLVGRSVELISAVMSITDTTVSEDGCSGIESLPTNAADKLAEFSEDLMQPLTKAGSKQSAISAEVESKCTSHKRKADVSEGLIVRGKRRLKINHRFLDDFDGRIPRLTGRDRRVRDGSDDSRHSSTSSVSVGSNVSRSASMSTRASLKAQKRAHARLNSRNALPTNRSSVVSNRESEPKAGKGLRRSKNISASVPANIESASTVFGPRVKQISRPALKPNTGKYASAVSAMVHAARLAAVGAKIPGGTSPNHAALAATARANMLEFTEQESNDSDLDPEPNKATKSDVSKSLPNRCGQCPACCGLVQPCGRCSNCRSLQYSTSENRSSNARPCKELTCFRRRPTPSGVKSGPRIKIPSNFPSPGNSNVVASHGFKNGELHATTQPNTNKCNSFPPGVVEGSDHSSISLLDTVPDLARRLELDAWLTQSSDVQNDQNSLASSSGTFFHYPKRVDVLNVFSEAPVTPISGGDLGMRFAASDPTNITDADDDRIRPVEGEVITTNLAHHGGYAIVTTMAAAPPKEICYACGSGGGQLLFCVSCAEPFHFYCVERQFRPRRKDHFICRNCTQCRRCRQPAPDLRCVRCSAGYHPRCLPDYAPAQSCHRGSWVCPHCATCAHCGLRPFMRPSEENSIGSDTASVLPGGGLNVISWSTEPSKCAACSEAEARGDICPECDRAYLPSAKQMIQCDTCQLWMHRTCTKLTADEYEWIARLPAGQLSKFVVKCTVCQNECKQEKRLAGKSPSPTNYSLESDVDGSVRLRSLARDTLMERMTGFVAGCRRPIDAESSGDHHQGIKMFTDGNSSSPDFPSRVHPDALDSNRSRRIPQLDGVFDDDSCEVAYRRNKADTFRRSPLYMPASDVLFYDHFDPSTSHCSLSSSHTSMPGDLPGRNSMKPSGLTNRHSDPDHTHLTRAHEDHASKRGNHQIHLSRQFPTLPSPPTSASWVAESESEHTWTSPRFLLYRMLTRILHRLAAHPINSPYAFSLRGLLRWLSSASDSFFPWLNITDMANEVRDVLRQANGEFSSVWTHFEKCSLIEMYELLCPCVAREIDVHLHYHLPPLSTPRLWNNVSRVQNCLLAVSQHLKAHHPSAMLLTNNLPFRLAESKHIVAAKASVDRSKASQCSRPHELEVMDKMRNETREERWVEYWSTIEEDMVLQNFQRHLLYLHRRLLCTTTKGLTVPTPPVSQSPVNTSDEMVNVDSICSSVHPPISSTEDNGDEIHSQNLVVLPQFIEKVPVFSAVSHERFYFALDEFWTAATGSERQPKSLEASCNVVDLDGLSDDDHGSEDEDARRCLLCARHGDNNIEGRLLFTGADTWVHVNCALWSNEVYEEESGQLIGLSDALRRGRSSVCDDCGRYGATMVCSNAHESTCTLYGSTWLPIDDSLNTFCLQKAVHFACALRRRPPTPRSVFTADRSWFCSPECHRSATRQRLMDAAHTLYSQKLDRCGKRPADKGFVNEFPIDSLKKDEYAMLENSVADDLEPINLGELLVCRRVFVPSDCFAASLYPSSLDELPRRLHPTVQDSPLVMEAIQEAVSNLATSPNSLAFLKCYGLPASNLVMTIGSLRVDRLGEVREASDSLTHQKLSKSTEPHLPAKRSNYLCPVNYRARRIYWSCYKLGDRISYTLQIKQTYAMGHCASGSLVAPSDSQKSTSLHSLASTRFSVPSLRLNPAPSSCTNTGRFMVTGSPTTTLPSNQPSDICRSVTHSNTASESVSSVSNSLARLVSSVPSSPSVMALNDSLNTPAVSITTNVPATDAHNTSLRILNTVSLSQSDSSNLTLAGPHHIRQRFSVRMVPNLDARPWRSQTGVLHSRGCLPAPQRNSFIGNTTAISPSSDLSRPSVVMLPVLSVGNQASTNVVVPSPMTIQVSRPGGTYRFPCPKLVTTPTKDIVLANQLNGLFQNIPAFPVQPLKANPLRLPIHRIAHTELSSQTISCVRFPQRLLPQLDGAFDSDDEERHIVKRSRLPNREYTYPRKRSGSFASSESSSSNRTVTSRSNLGQSKWPDPKNKKLPVPSPQKQHPVKRRWIEERNKQQELAHLVSKAKQANQARLYQNEIEKHARSFKLRFTIDGIVRAAPHPSSAWRAVVGRVVALREKQGLPALINQPADGWTQFGLNHRHIVFLIEQMRGAFHCYRYRFRYHWRKVDELRRKFTPPVPVTEGCARFIVWSKPRLSYHQARDPLSFLSCRANPPPRPLLKVNQNTLSQKGKPLSGSNILSPNEPAATLSPNEQRVCAEAAREAATLVAQQLKLPLRVREACIVQAVVQATGFPVKSAVPDSVGVSRLKIEKCESGCLSDAEHSDLDKTHVESSSDGGEDISGEADRGTVTTQFKRMVSGHMARYLRVSVHPSRIHGRGLFALRGFVEDEMIIEYLGELIRNLICETREVRYRAAGVDCYMFRISEDLVIDATYAGNAARFINHSCEPNCYAKVVTADDKKHIVILAQRRIYPGEELTYDYRFPKEADKLLCSCGSFNCRKYLN